MSTPFSPTPLSNLEDISKEPALEVDDNFEADSPSNIESKPSAAETTPTSSKTGVIALVLGLLLLGSVALNIQQARVSAALSAESQQYEAAMNEAIAVVEQETKRANSAESTLGEIGTAVDHVNDRVESLQQALGELRSATAR